MSMPRGAIGLSGFGDVSATHGPTSVAVLRQHLLRGDNLMRPTMGQQRSQAGHKIKEYELGLA